MLTWDLHIHPGPVSEGRWGDGAAVQQAAARAGLKGFLWKSHAGSSAEEVAALAAGPTMVLPSLVLNPAIVPGEVERALLQGVRWFWGPSRNPDGSLGWELPLPRDWTAIARLLSGSGSRLVLATSHLDRTGRAAVSALCEGTPELLCSVTHSLYLSDDETRELAGAGAVFEADLFTMTRTVRDWPRADLSRRVDLVGELDTISYLTSDAGQAATGDPYVFAAGEIAKLGTRRPDQIESLTHTGPDLVAAHITRTEGGLP